MSNEDRHADRMGGKAMGALLTMAWLTVGGAFALAVAMVDTRTTRVEEED